MTFSTRLPSPGSGHGLACTPKDTASTGALPPTTSKRTLSGGLPRSSSDNPGPPKDRPSWGSGSGTTRGGCERWPRAPLTVRRTRTYRRIERHHNGRHELRIGTCSAHISRPCARTADHRASRQPQLLGHTLRFRDSLRQAEGGFRVSSLRNGAHHARADRSRSKLGPWHSREAARPRCEFPSHGAGDNALDRTALVLRLAALHSPREQVVPNRWHRGRSVPVPCPRPRRVPGSIRFTASHSGALIHPQNDRYKQMVFGALIS